MTTIPETLSLIKSVHTDKVYGDGPFHLHPIAVALALPENAPEYAKLAALLHDVLEDSDTTEADLVAAGYESRVVELVKGLTRPAGVTYMDWIRRITSSGDKWLIQIKLADNRVNLHNRPDMASRYERSIAALEGALTVHHP